MKVARDFIQLGNSFVSGKNNNRFLDFVLVQFTLLLMMKTVTFTVIREYY